MRRLYVAEVATEKVRRRFYFKEELLAWLHANKEQLRGAYLEISHPRYPATHIFQPKEDYWEVIKIIHPDIVQKYAIKKPVRRIAIIHNHEELINFIREM